MLAEHDFISVVSSAFPDLDDPIVTVHQSIGEAKEQFYYERTVFLRCVANSNPPVRYSWRRGQEVLLQGSDKGVEIYEPFFTQVGNEVAVFISPSSACTRDFVTGCRACLSAQPCWVPGVPGGHALQRTTAWHIHPCSF